MCAHIKVKLHVVRCCSQVLQQITDKVVTKAFVFQIVSQSLWIFWEQYRPATSFQFALNYLGAAETAKLSSKLCGYVL